MTITKQPYQIVIVFLFLLLLPCHALSSTAEGSLPPYRFSTFGTLGIAYTPGDISPSHTMGDKNSFHDHFSWPYDSLLGLQADIQFTPSFSATAQLVLKERVDNSLDETLEWAFVRWRPNDLVSIRGGRMGADFYMLADYRNVSYAYLWQRPPSEFYTPVLVENFDGLDITLSTKAGQGLLQCKLFGGSSVKPILFSSDAAPTDLDFKPFYGGRLSYELNTWQLSGGFATTTIDSEVSYLRPVVHLPPQQP